MKTIIKISIIALGLFLTKQSFAQDPYQFTTVKYAYDANGNRWNRSILFTLNKMSPSDTITTSVHKPFKESVLDSFGIKEIVIFPNPTLDMVKVNIVSAFASPLTGTIKVFNTLGTTQYINQTIQLNNDIDFTLLAAGLYILKIEVNGQVKTYKVLKN
ncbi:MAG: T9SS type A sorting domain-containing protein [Bacteroidota bacterium]